MIASPGLIRHLVVLPGMDGTGQLLAPFAEALGDRLRLLPVVYPRTAADYATFTEAATAVIDRVPGDFALLAESFSGPVALTLARRSPRGLRGLVLVSALVAPPPRALWRLVSALPLGWLFGLPLPGRIPGAFLLGSRPPAGALALLNRVRSSWSPETMAGRVRLLGAIDPVPGPLSLPALYLRPSRDLVLPSGAVHAARRCLPALEVITVPGPHILLAARPHHSAALVCAFVRRLECLDGEARGA